MHRPTRRKLFRQYINVFATLVLELKYLNAAQHPLCDAAERGGEGEMPRLGVAGAIGDSRRPDCRDCTAAVKPCI
jgi:hypothetical protein